MRIFIAALLLCLLPTWAEACDRHSVSGCSSFEMAAPMSRRVSSGGQVVAPPAGCPARAFCGCGVSLYVFGKAVARGGLAIAANWLRFPRAAPAAGMVAARRGHVMAIV